MSIFYFLVLYYLQFVGRRLVAAEITIYVDATFDGPADERDCYPTPTPGQCTLRSAWASCTATATKCSIQLNSAVYLTSPDVYGPMELFSTSYIEILGGGSTIRNNGGVAPFGLILYFDLETYVPATLLVYDTKFYGFSSRFGSVLLSIGECNLLFQNSEFYSNTADQFGGALFIAGNWYGHMNVTNCLFYGNIASSGGSLFMDDCYNILVRDSYFEADAVYSRGASVYLSEQNYGATLQKLIFVNTYSMYAGGAIALGAFNNDVLIEDCTFVGTAAYADTGGNGGVVRLETANLRFTMRNCDMIDTYSHHGGAVYLYSENHFSVLENCNFFGVHAKHTGGSVKYYQFNDNALIQGCRFDCNPAHLMGSGGAVSLTNGNKNLIISESSFENCSSKNGGGAFEAGYDNHKISLKYSNISNCHATEGSGGGVYLGSNNQNPDLVGSVLSFNTASEYGGAIYSSDGMSDFTIAGTLISNNTASISGGGVYVSVNHPRFLVTDIKSYLHKGIVESEHPYASGLGDVMVSTTVSVPGAVKIIISFDEQTNIYSLTDKVDIWDSEEMNELYFWAGGKWPAIDLPVLMIPSSSFFIRFYAYRENNQYVFPDYSFNLYGFKLYYVPEFGEVGLTTRFVGNKALQVNGGGLYFYDHIDFSIILSTDFEDNYSEQDGGGIYYRVSNIGSSLISTRFAGNAASGSGGGICFLSAHGGVFIYGSIFFENLALKNGGGVALLRSNGHGLFATSNSMTFSNCNFTGDTAAGGGSLYLGSDNVVEMSDISMEACTANLLSGGCIHLDSQNALELSQASIRGSYSAVCGGAIASSLLNNVALTNVELNGNVADLFGGAACFQNDSSVTFQGKVSIVSNRALFGGGLVLTASPIWDLVPDSTLDLSKNYADRGSAALFVEVKKGPHSLHDITITGNVAQTGGTVFWIYDTNVMSAEPTGLDSDSIVWRNNEAVFGEVAATQGISAVVPSRYNVNNYAAAIEPPIEVYLLDYYGSRISVQGDTVVYVSVLDPDPLDCKGNYPYLAGQSYTNGVVMSNASAIFDDLEVYCAPEGAITVQFEFHLGALLRIPVGKSSQYYLRNHTKLSFRHCVDGEYESNALCVQCGLGTYSLFPRSSVCTECISTDGVDYCEANLIDLLDGYWRRYESNAAVLKCPIAGGCIGGSGVGNELCAKGHEGPLCAVCSDGYYNNGASCNACSDRGLFTAGTITLMILTVLVICLLLLYYFRDYWHPKNDENGERFSIFGTANEIYQKMLARFKKSVIKMKIIVATFQIVVETAAVLSVSLPSSFNYFSDTFDFINVDVGSMVPASCSGPYDFFGQLILTTLGPIFLCGVFLCGFAIQYFLELKRKTAEEMKHAVLELEDKYLNYFFYLTYLVLPSVTVKIFQTFICTNADPDAEDSNSDDFYLTADMTISCSSAYYEQIVVYAAFMILVYPVGIPAMYFYFLYQNRHEIMTRDDPAPMNSAASEAVAFSETESGNPIIDTKDEGADGANVDGGDVPDAERDTAVVESKVNLLTPSAKRLGFLWDAYEPKFWYWELVETSRRLVLTAVLSVCNSGTSDQGVLSILLAVVYIKLYSYFAPYVADQDDILAETGQYQIFFTFFFALVIQNSLLSSTLDGVLGATLIIINLGVLFLGFYFEMLDHYEAIKEDGTGAEKESLLFTLTSFLRSLYGRRSSVWPTQPTAESPMSS